MQISHNSVVRFFYTLVDEHGNEIENNHDASPMAYLHGHSNIFTKLEEGLEGLSVGDKKRITLPPHHAYGAYKENTNKKVPTKHLLGKHKKLLPGQLVKVNTEKGAVDARVIKAGKFMVELDFNHPLAGLTLTFDVTIDSIRDASAEERAHGHAHGIGGHHH